MEKKLQRDVNDKMIAGVASGLAEHLSIDTALVRIGFLLALFAGFGFLLYIILWIAVPAKPYSADYRVDASSIRSKKSGNGYMVVGMLLVFMGIYFLLDEFDIIPYWFEIHKFWPLAIIIPGLLIISRALRAEEPYIEPDTTWDKRTDSDIVKTSEDKDQII